MNRRYVGVVILTLLFIFLTAGVEIVQPTERGSIERSGQFKRFASPGFSWIIPVIDRIYLINNTETMVDAEPQEIITNDNLNARVDARVHFKVTSDEESVKYSLYPENDRRHQIVSSEETP